MSIPETSTPRFTAGVGGLPIHPMLVPIPITCFVATLLTDIVYWQTADMLWSDMSDWLLTAGLVMALFAVLAGLIDFICDRRIRALRAAWIHGIGSALALALEIINAFVHTRDAYTSVVPTGLTLSALSVLILFVTAWSGWAMVYRHGIGIDVAKEEVRR